MHYHRKKAGKAEGQLALLNCSAPVHFFHHSFFHSTILVFKETRQRGKNGRSQTRLRASFLGNLEYASASHYS